MNAVFIIYILLSMTVTIFLYSESMKSTDDKYLLGLRAQFNEHPVRTFTISTIASLPLFVIGIIVGIWEQIVFNK